MCLLNRTFQLRFPRNKAHSCRNTSSFTKANNGNFTIVKNIVLTATNTALPLQTAVVARNSGARADQYTFLSRLFRLLPKNSFLFPVFCLYFVKCCSLIINDVPKIYI